MAVVPTSSGPEVKSVGTPSGGVYQTEINNPAAFGAGSAAALGDLGKSLEKVGGVEMDMATNMAIQKDIREAKDAHTQSMMYADKLAFVGDGTEQNPRGYFAMKGQAALDYSKTYLDALRGQADQATQGMSTRAANMYRAQFDSSITAQTASAQRFAMQQNVEANNLSSDARIQAATGSALNRYNDPGWIEQQAQVVRGEVSTQNAGQSPETIAALTQQKLGKLYSDVIETALSKGDVATAARQFNLYEQQMDPATRVTVAQKLHQPLLRKAANDAANELVGDNTTIGDRPAGAPDLGTGHRNATPSRLDQGAISRSKDVYQGLLDRGIDEKFGPGTALAFAANGVQESAGNKLNLTGDGGFAHGLFMWRTDAPSGARALDFKEKYGHLPSQGTLDEQLDFVMHELGGKESNAAKMIAGAAPGDKAAAVSKYYERPKTTDNEMRVRTGHALALGQAFGLQPGEYGTKGAAGAPGPVGPPGDSSGGPVGLAAVEKTDSPRTVADVARNTQLHPDFGAAKEAALAKYGEDPEMLNMTLSYISKRQAVYNLGVKTQQTAFRKSFADTAASLADGNDVKIDEIGIRHAFDPVTADDMLNKLHEAQEFGQTYKTVKSMTPDQYQEERGRLAASLGQPEQGSTRQGNIVTPGEAQPSPEAGVTGYAKRKKELETLDATFAKAQKDLRADPAAYVRSSDFPDVAGTFAAITSDPATVAAAIDKSKAVQMSLGIDPSETRTLSNDTVGKLVKRLHSVDPETGDAGKELDDMSKQYGTAWPGVMHDLVVHGHLAPAYQVLASMTEPSQAGPRANLQRALQAQATKGDRFGSGVPIADKPLLAQSVETALQPFKDTTVVGGGEMFDSVVAPAVKTLTTFYAEQGLGADASAQRAVKEIVDAKYEMSGMTRAPKTFNGRPLGVEAVLGAGRTVLDSLKAEDLAQGTATLRQAQRGSWVTNPDGAGVTLVAPAAQGGYLPVRRKDGSYVSMSFGDLPAAKAETIPGIF